MTEKFREIFVLQENKKYDWLLLDKKLPYMEVFQLNFFRYEIRRGYMCVYIHIFFLGYICSNMIFKPSLVSNFEFMEKINTQCSAGCRFLFVELFLA